MSLLSGCFHHLPVPPEVRRQCCEESLRRTEKQNYTGWQRQFTGHQIFRLPLPFYSTEASQESSCETGAVSLILLSSAGGGHGIVLTSGIRAKWFWVTSKRRQLGGWCVSALSCLLRGLMQWRHGLGSLELEMEEPKTKGIRIPQNRHRAESPS